MAYVRDRYNVPYHLRQKPLPKVEQKIFYIGGPNAGVRDAPSGASYPNFITVLVPDRRAGVIEIGTFWASYKPAHYEKARTEIHFDSYKLQHIQTTTYIFQGDLC